MPKRPAIPKPMKLVHPNKSYFMQHLERRIVTRSEAGLFRIAGLSYLWEPPLELEVKRGKSSTLHCRLGMNTRAVVYQELVT